MKDNSDIDGGGTSDTNRSLGRSQGSFGSGKKTGGNRSRSRREQKDNRNEHVGDMNGNASITTASNALVASSTQSVKVPRQATAEQIRIAQLLSNGEEEKTLKIKVGQVVELTGCDQDTAALSLHDCDGDVTMSVHMILDARANSIDNSSGFVDEVKPDEWQTTSKRHPKKIATSDSTNGHQHDSTTDKVDDWSSKSKDGNRDRRARRGASERRGGSRLRPGSGNTDPNGEDSDRRRNRSERRGRGGGRGRGEHRVGRGRPTDSVSPIGGKDDSHYINGSTDNDYGSFRSEGPDASRDQTFMPPRFDGARRGGRGSRGGGSGSRIFNYRGRGSRGRSRMSFGQTRDKSSVGPTDSSIPNWTNDFNEGSTVQPPPNGDEGWDDMNEWDSVWCGETQVFTNSKVAVESTDISKVDHQNSELSEDKCATTLEDDDPAIVNSVSSAQLNEAAIAAFNHRATEAIKTSLGIGGPLGPDDPKPQRAPRSAGSDRGDTSKPTSSASSCHDKSRLRAAIEEEILGGNGPKHARSKPPPPSKKPEQQVELPRLRGIPSDPSLTGFSFAFGSLDEIAPIDRPNDKLESKLVSSPVSLPSSVDTCGGKSGADTAALPESTIQEYLSSSLNSNSFQSSTERQPTPSASTVSPVKPPSLSATPNQFHSPLKSVDTETINVSADPFQSSAGITSELSSELSAKLSTRTETQQTTQTQTAQEAVAVSLSEQTSRNDVSSVPSVMDKATQPTPSSSQHNTPNKATGVSRSQQTNAPQNAAAAAAAAAAAGGANLLNTLPAVSALLNYPHLATPGQHFPYINIPAMQQHGTIDYEQIVQQQQRIIYDLAQLQTQQQQHTSQTPPSQPAAHHTLQNQHQHDPSTSISVSVTSTSNSANTSNVTNSVPGNSLKSMSSSMRGSSVGDVQSPSALPGSALPHLQTVVSSGVVSSTSGVASTAAPHNVFMPPGYPPFYHNYYPPNPAAAAAAAAQAQAAAPPGHHPNAGPPAYNATLFSLMNSMNQQPVSQALSSPPQFGSSMGVGKTQSSNNVFGSYSDRAYGASSTGGFDEHLTDIKYSGLNTGKDTSNPYGSSTSGTGKPSSLGVGPGSSAYHSGGSSGGSHRGNSMTDSSSGSRNAGNSSVDGSNKNMSGSGAVAPGAGASGFPFPLAGNPGLYNPAGYVPYMTHAHHHHLAAQSQQPFEFMNLNPTGTSRH